jgi:16S rRNA (guanine527-N7)-methyltransferase
MLREACDVAVARAVGAMDFLVEWCLPLVKKGGRMLAMKGARIAEELPAARKAIHLLSGGAAVVHPVELPGTEHRVIVEIPKVGRTDLKYPRDPTVAKGKAIG